MTMDKTVVLQKHRGECSFQNLARSTCVMFKPTAPYIASVSVTNGATSQAWRAVVLRYPQCRVRFLRTNDVLLYPQCQTRFLKTTDQQLSHKPHVSMQTLYGKTKLQTTSSYPNQNCFSKKIHWRQTIEITFRTLPRNLERTLTEF